MPKASVTEITKGEYLVQTDLPPEMLSQVGLEIFKLWMDFATGASSLGGKRIVYPTGRYASSIQYQEQGMATVAVVADARVAREAAILEVGHGRVDLKTKLRPGRYPMHRPVDTRTNAPLRRVGPGGPVSTRPEMWAAARADNSSGYASIGPNSPPDSWIIPPMPAYSPALVLANMAAAMARGTGG